MSAFPILNSKSLDKSYEESETKSPINCDKYNTLFKYESNLSNIKNNEQSSLQNKYNILYNMSIKELEEFKQCQIKWLKEN